MWSLKTFVVKTLLTCFLWRKNFQPRRLKFNFTFITNAIPNKIFRTERKMSTKKEPPPPPTPLVWSAYTLSSPVTMLPHQPTQIVFVRCFIKLKISVLLYPLTNSLWTFSLPISGSRNAIIMSSPIASVRSSMFTELINRNEPDKVIEVPTLYSSDTFSQLDRYSEAFFQK